MKVKVLKTESDTYVSMEDLIAQCTELYNNTDNKQIMEDMRMVVAVLEAHQTKIIERLSKNDINVGMFAIEFINSKIDS